MAICVLPFISFAQQGPQGPIHEGTITSVEYVAPIADRLDELTPSFDKAVQAQDKRSLGALVRTGGDPNDVQDYFTKNRNALEGSAERAPVELTFDAYSSNSQPTDPSLAVGPNHVIVVFNTGFTIYDKNGNQLLGQTSPNPAIFPSGGCCDLTASYDNAADRWVLTFLGNGAQVAVSDGPNPLTSGWFVYNISAINDYQKLSVWSDGYYITDNTNSANRVWALERDAMLAGSPTAKILGFNLPGIRTSGFYSPQALNVTDGNLPAPGGATIVYMQDDAWNGVNRDHMKLWKIDVDWNNANNSTVSQPNEIDLTPFVGVFDNGSFSNLTQPGGGARIDALQATIMNQAQFRKFGTHNSAVFDFVVDVEAGSAKRAGVRWMEFRQSADNQPWTLYQEGTYTAPNGRHAWHASLAMDGQGNIGMGYSSMSGPSTPSTVRVSSYYTSRLSGDPLGTMTGAEELIRNGNQNIPGTRYGDYSKIDVDPSDDQSFWFINEYMNNGRKGVVGKFKVANGTGDTVAPTTPTSLAVNSITGNSATVTWTASTDNVGVASYTISLDGTIVGNTAATSFGLTGLSGLTQYNVTVTASDAAGNTSGGANTSFTTLENNGNPGTIAGYFFEQNSEGWSDPGSDAGRVNNSTAAFEGQFCIGLRDDSTTSNSQSPVLNLAGNNVVTIEFHVFSAGMENGENFFVEFFNGTSYQTVGNYTAGVDFFNNNFFDDTITLDGSSFNFNGNNRIRFRNNGSNNNDRICFDAVVVSGDNVTAQQATTEVVVVSNDASASRSFTQNSDKNIKMYPNPASTQLTIEILEDIYDEVQIISAMGRVVQTIKPDGSTINVDLSNLASGMYFAQFVSGKRAVTKKFVKQ